MREYTRVLSASGERLLVDRALEVEALVPARAQSARRAARRSCRRARCWWRRRLTVCDAIELRAGHAAGAVAVGADGGVAGPGRGGGAGAAGGRGRQRAVPLGLRRRSRARRRRCGQRDRQSVARRRRRAPEALSTSTSTSASPRWRRRRRAAACGRRRASIVVAAGGHAHADEPAVVEVGLAGADRHGGAVDARAPAGEPVRVELDDGGASPSTTAS